ncbi:hypothetical protein AJ80_09983 [Polytolypa hystricis UAMH7299]|uniref:ABC transporter domain-containing protein n=1 Tax=Polytolypa hystricis (strain UAMH7299) TaxID=1447883 RepID=A0A2B7WFF4_POLH7|nr:hypothetical protein AJ80_09983 [Polytolypa hystricis UAMH7299]
MSSKVSAVLSPSPTSPLDVTSKSANKNGKVLSKLAWEAWGNSEREKSAGVRWWRFIRFLCTAAWPVGNRRLQLHCFGLGLCVLADRAINFLIPLNHGQLIDRLIGSGTLSRLDICRFAVLHFLDTGSITSAIRMSLLCPLEHYWVKKLKVGAFDRIMALSGDFHEGNDPSTSSKLISSGEEFSKVMIDIFLLSGPLLLDTLSAKVSLYYIDARVALLFTAVAVTYVYVYHKFLLLQQNPQRQLFHDLQREVDVVREPVLNWRTVSYFNGFKLESTRLTEAIDLRFTTQKKSNLYTTFRNAIQASVLVVGLILACTIISQSNRSVGEFAAMLTYWTRLCDPLKCTVRTLSGLRERIARVEPFTEIFEKTPSVVDAGNASILEINHADIEFENVTFSYPGQRPILRGVSFSIQDGQTVAIVGATGSGKTTITKLLFRLYDPQSGSIRISGKNILDVKMESLRSNIAVAPQECEFFRRSVTENIKYANHQCRMEDMHGACKAAAIHDRILKYPKGFHTVIESKKLSGGEARRVNIARGLTPKKRVLVLDEPTNGLDNVTIAWVQEHLRKDTKGRTTVIISHDPSLTRNADKIVVLSEGRVVEEGDHDTLLNMKGHYFRQYTARDS